MSHGYICATCGTPGDAVEQKKGSFAVELVLWLLFCFPGIIYSVWRMSNLDNVCRVCNSQTMIPLGTPRGEKLYKEMGFSHSAGASVGSWSAGSFPLNRKLQLIGYSIGGFILIFLIAFLSRQEEEPQQPFHSGLTATKVANMRRWQDEASNSNTEELLPIISNSPAPSSIVSKSPSDDDAKIRVFHFYRQQASAGESYAQYRVGEMFLRGQGTETNIIQARKWLTMAATNGQPEAAALLKGLSR